MSRGIVFSFATAAALIAGAASAASPGSGTVVKSTGHAEIVRLSSKVPANPGETVLVGDAITTGSDGRVQLRLTDDSSYVVPADSSIKLEDMVLPDPAGKGGGRLIISLVKGGLRAISGFIGKGPGDIYELRSPVATMGVRGTDFITLSCQGNCKAKGKAKAYPPGLYVKVNSGTVIVSNNGGRIAVGSKTTAYVASKDSAPAIVQDSPLDDPDFAATVDVGLDAEFKPGEEPRIETEISISPG